MAAKAKKGQKSSKANGAADWKGLIERVALAGVGAVSLAQEELETFVGRLVDRGEIASKDGRKILAESLRHRQDQAGRAAKVLNGKVKDVRGKVKDVRVKVTKAVDSRIEDLLHVLRVPTHKDVDALNRKVETLTKKVDTLITKKGGKK